MLVLRVVVGTKKNIERATIIHKMIRQNDTTESTHKAGNSSKIQILFKLPVRIARIDLNVSSLIIQVQLQWYVWHRGSNGAINEWGGRGSKHHLRRY